MKHDLIKERLNGLSDKHQKLVRNFIKHLGSASQDTINSYTRVTVGFLCFAEKERINVEKFKPFDIEDYINDISGLKGSSEGTYLATISSFFDFLMLREIVTFNPVIILRKLNKKRWVKDTNIGDTITVSQFECLLQAAGSQEKRKRYKGFVARDIAAISLLGGSGIRSIELIRANIEDFNLSEGTLKVLGKGNKYRIVALSDAAILATKYYLEVGRIFFHPDKSERAMFFGMKRGKEVARINSCQISTLVRSAFKRSQIPVRNIGPHTLRRSHATWLLQRTGNLKLVQDQLGHSDISTTQRYIKMADTERIRAVREAFSPHSNDGLDS